MNKSLVPPNSIQAILFDMDGVLVSTEHLHYESWRLAFDAEGINLSNEDYNKKCRAQGQLNGIRNMIPMATPQDIQRIGSCKSQYYKKILIQNGIDVFEDAVQLLVRLRDYPHRKAIASSSSTADFVITHTPYKEDFNVIITGNDIIKNKPYPDIFLQACERLGVSPANSIVIEDSIAGVLAARRAGIDVLAINRGGSLDGTDPINLTDICLDYPNMSLEEKENIRKTSTSMIDVLTDVLDYL